jgi:hypothetical protein
MADLESVVGAAFAEANTGGEESTPDVEGTPDPDPGSETPLEDSPETPAVEETPAAADTPVAEEEVAAEGVDTPAAKPAAKPAEKDQLAKDLEELGLTPPKKGERENRLPHNRVRKIAENYGKKVEARFTGEIETLKGENTKLQKVAENVSNVDKLIAENPDRYITMLSTIHPGKYDKFLANAAAAPKAAKEPAKAASTTLGPRPAPDHKFEDGSQGYTPEQHEKLMDWVAAKAKEEAKAEAIAEIEERMEKKYGKIAKSHEAQEELDAKIPLIKAEVADVYETWGKELVDKHEAEIVALMQKNPTWAPAKAVAKVLLPKVRADRNTMRNELIIDQKKRTAAAARTVPGAVVANKDDDGPKTLEDVVRNAILTLKR